MWIVYGSGVVVVVVESVVVDVVGIVVVVMVVDVVVGSVVVRVVVVDVVVDVPAHPADNNTTKTDTPVRTNLKRDNCFLNIFIFSPWISLNSPITRVFILCFLA
jgi:hypothetical protein